MAALSDNSQHLFDWYHTLFSRRVDLVGDYAGNELFLIEFDSLLLYCFSDSRIDFHDGFQLLHAVYTVEKLLMDLVSRKCNFDIVCFDQNKHLCVPPSINKDTTTKYLLARYVVLQHLQRNMSSDIDVSVHCFQSFTDTAFVNYLKASGVYFFMCHDGTMSNQKKSKSYITQQASEPGNALKALRTTKDSTEIADHIDLLSMSETAEYHCKCNLRAMISWFILNNYNVALINEIHLMDTKAMTVVMEFSRSKDIPDLTMIYDSNSNVCHPISYRLEDIELPDCFSERDAITLLALANSMDAKQLSVTEACSILLHSTALQFLPLKNRTFIRVPPNELAKNVISSFTQSALSILSDSKVRTQLDQKSLVCNLGDLFDGSLLVLIMANDKFRSCLLNNESLKTKFEIVCTTLSKLCGENIMTDDKSETASINDINLCNFIDRPVLPFNNEVFDKHLAPIHLEIDTHSTTLMTSNQSKVFQELSHWHNHKKTIAVKGSGPKQEWWERRRNQWFMAEMHAYAASLTNAAGKVLDPESIIAGQNIQSIKQKKIVPPTGTSKSEQSSNQVSKGGKKSNGPPKKGGKAAALGAAAAIQAGRIQSKVDTDIAFWKAKCKEVTLKGNPQIAYTLMKAHLNDIQDILRPEVECFMIDCLVRIWIETHKTVSASDSMDIVALIWDSYLRLSKIEVGITPEIVVMLEIVSKLLGLPVIDFTANSPNRPLSFNPMFTKQPKKSLTNDHSNLLIPGGATNFQLEYCGQYFDRAIDSAPDPRVPFQPDAWQRKVLDAIDQEKSLFVVAPTSAGKTFISFYAMKKILQASDDDVVVYVAPTKALVNQIAAEIQARFSKSFKHPGRSVWGIHTRDYRVNNPTGCQVLVTVPHLLQIMLLAPSHAEKKNSWSCRIKCIIFDEVHCIGQAEDGVIWEQLLLQAPCPIIALSATVGNPQEFSDWLSSTQEATGNELVTVQHDQRYSDLRKFIYVPPKDFCFKGLPDIPSIHIPGLDGTNAFVFVHPVSSLINKARGMPSDLSLEARDCLWLWKCMSKHQTEKHSLPSKLQPDIALPIIIRKIDISKWEKDLKSVLVEWMIDDESPFEKVRNELGERLDNQNDRDSLSTKHSCDNKCNKRLVNQNDLKSTILPALVDLHAKDALPAIVFNYDRRICEKLASTVVNELKEKEKIWKKNNANWRKKIAEFEKWTKDQEAAISRNKTATKPTKKKGKRGDDEDEEEKTSKLDRQREDTGDSKWADFDPLMPIEGFHFADIKKLAPSELKEYQHQLRRRHVPEWLVQSLERGVGVHHAGMNRKYRQVTEILFRKGFLRVVIATGTLALGINMPCKTVVFAGDSVFLTALNFRQGAGRAGRRGFDVLGNVVFLGIPTAKVFRILSSKLPDLNGHFPITTSLVLRLATLLHESRNSQFAIQTIDSILSQPRLYLGSPSTKIAVLHHLRFSIEYLRRQSLLDINGTPLNFAGCVSHLYYTENSAWSFHALLSSGYFHSLCKDVETSPIRICSTLMLVLAHIFGRYPCKRSDNEYIEHVVKHSSSIVFLPPLPEEAQNVLRLHNEETLAIFQTYVKTYVDQYLPESDDKLPLTKLQIGSDSMDIPKGISLSSTVVRSPFVALSGHGDHFDNISDLCNTVRSGVFLEESVIPYLQIYPDESDIPLNAYLYDFYKHGDIKTIEHANRIRSSDVWFHLNDFSLVLATIITSLTNFMKLSPSDSQLMDMMGSGDAYEEQQDDKAIDKESGMNTVDGKDEDDGTLNPDNEENWNSENEDETGLENVLKAFKLVQKEFNQKFKKMWA